MNKFLRCYPFADPNIQLVEGFRAYDGTLGDPPGTPHKGIDYILIADGSYASFNVHAMHDGTAYRGVSTSWGNFVLIYATASNGRRYRTVYAHLDSIPESIAPHTIAEDGQYKRNPQGTPIRAGDKIGQSGTSGWTNGFIQLHLELHDVTDMSEDENERRPVKLDPYGLDDRASSGRYPQPGQALVGLDHAWTCDEPPFAIA